MSIHSYDTIKCPLVIYTKVVLLGLEEGCFLILGEIIILISKAAVPVCTPTSNAEVFHLPHNLCSINCHDILKFAGKWMDLENIILSELTQTQKDKYYMYKLLSDF